MLELAPPWWFAAAAAAMVVVAALFVVPRPWRSTRVAGGAQESAARHGPRWQRMLLLLVLPAAAVAMYLWLGNPGALHPERAGLSAQLRASDEPLGEAATGHALAELQQHLERHPDDARAWVIKSRLDMRAQRFDLAAAGFERALKDGSKTAGDARVWVEYAEARGMQQGGTLAGLPRQLVDKALSLNPELAQALDLAGSAAWEAGEFGLAVIHWKRLLAQIPEGDPRHVQLSTAIQRAEQRARFALPPSR